MKKCLIFFIALSCNVALRAQQKLTPVAAQSSINFTIRNFGFNTRGDLSGLKGKLYFDKNHLAQSSFDITVDVATINTGNSQRDKHLLKSQQNSMFLLARKLKFGHLLQVTAMVFL